MPLGYTNKEFISKAREVHGRRYTYSRLQYAGARVKVIITCRRHGDFKQTPNSHLNNDGCPVCGGKQQCTLEEFIKKAQRVHGKQYDYSKTKYVRALDAVVIVCRTHGEFKQTPHTHLRPAGCPICNESCGEKKVSRILEHLKVPFSRQFKDPECRNKRALPFDFDVWLGGKPYLIEYHGVQHYRPSLLFGPRQFLQQKKHDCIKKEFCKKNRIPLLTIPYWKRNIEGLIRGFLNKSL